MSLASAPAPSAGTTPSPQAAWWARWRADRQLPAVLLVWALCWLAYGLYLAHFASPLPFCDEWCHLTPVATGHQPLSWAWVWDVANEHRAPLTRLEALLLSRLGGWDYRPARFIHLALLALSALALVGAARAVRGRAELSDIFLPLLVLTPMQFQTVLLYVYAYAFALALWCLALSTLMTGGPLRSPAALGLYLALALAVTLSGGPAGNCWALGLCGVVWRGWREGRPRAWKVTGLVGAALVVGVSVGMLLAAPRYDDDSPLYSTSWPNTLAAAAKLAVGWLGGPVLEETYPWAWLSLAVPGLYFLYRAVRGRWRRAADEATRPTAWVDLAAALLGALAVAAIIAYGRARQLTLWDSRYVTLLLPIGVTTYLLLVRCRAPAWLTGALAVAMALNVGWGWPVALNAGRFWHPRAAEAWYALREGKEPLSVLTERYALAVGYPRPGELLGYWEQLREAGLAPFQRPQAEPVSGLGPALLWEAQAGRLSGPLALVTDDRASGNTALLSGTASVPATAAYDVEVPANGLYLLCCRLAVADPGRTVRVQVDDGPVFERALPTAPDFFAYALEPLLELHAGRHVLKVTLPQPATRLDVVELVPRSGG